MNYTWNDYSGLVWGQEANSVANKSEYIRKEYARKSLKGLKYKKQNKENWMFCKVYKENQKRLEKYTTRWVCAADLGWWPFHPFFEQVSVWVVKVEEEAVYRVQSIGTTIPPNPPSFAMFLSLKATLILYAKGNESGL